MYKLEKSYGKNTYDVWCNSRMRDLRPTQTDPSRANRNTWPVRSYRELLERAAFLGSMNKRLTLFFRGQVQDIDPLPTLFRKSWKCFGSSQIFEITRDNRIKYWDELNKIGRRVYEICDTTELGLPRWRGLQNIRETQWTVIQHYGLWPTPLIDITNSLRVAATFAMGFQHGDTRTPRQGFLYVVGMPYSTGSITFDIDQQIILARLQSACPPVAKRPHYQEGFLVGRFPMYEVEEGLKDKSNLINRLIAKFELQDDGNFWNPDFPMIRETALLPNDDPLFERFIEEFGPQSRAYSLCERTQEILQSPHRPTDC
jgi:hypothetical protein